MDQLTVLLPGRRRAALATAGGAAAVLIGLGVAVAGSSRATGFDSAVKDWLDGWISHATADTFADFGGPFVLGPVAIALAVIFAARRWRCSAVLVVLAPIVSVALVDLVAKPLFDRSMDGIAGSLTYPSGHTAAVSAVACAVLVTAFGPGSWVFGSLRKAVASAGCVLLVLCCAAGLTVANDHYFTDTIGGAALAVAVTVLLAVAIDELAGWWRRRVEPGEAAAPAVRPVERSRP